MYQPSAQRYDTLQCCRCGKSGVRLPAISLGLWHIFSADRNQLREAD